MSVSPVSVLPSVGASGRSSCEGVLGAARGALMAAVAAGSGPSMIGVEGDLAGTVVVTGVGVLHVAHMASGARSSCDGVVLI